MVNQLAAALNLAPTMRLFCGLPTAQWLQKLQAEETQQIKQAKPTEPNQAKPPTLPKLVTNSMVKAFKTHYAAGESLSEIGAKAGISHTYVSQIKAYLIHQGDITERGQIKRKRTPKCK